MNILIHPLGTIDSGLEEQAYVITVELMIKDKFRCHAWWLQDPPYCCTVLRLSLM